MNNFEKFLIKINRRFFYKLGRRIYMNARYDYNDNCWEQMIQKIILQKANTNSGIYTILDVGANIGNWTHQLLTNAKKNIQNSQLNIHAFEPFPNTFNTLQKKLNGIKSNNHVLKLNNLALSDKVGEDYMFGSTNSGTSSIHENPFNGNDERVVIEKTTSDKYCELNSIDEILYLKCDTEGHDFEVIKGASNYLSKGKIQFFQFEYSYRWIYSRHYLKDVFDLIKDYPYKISKLTQNGLEIYEEWSPELERFFEVNYLLLRNDLINEFANRVLSTDSSNTYA